MAIKISGSAFRFDQKELDRRKAAYQNFYYSTMECRKHIRASLPHLFILSIIQHSSDGYVLDEKAPVIYESLHYRATMFKPEHVQMGDLAVVVDEIKAEYVLYLETQREKFKQLLKAQLLEADEAKEQKKLDIARAKRLAERLAEIEKEVSDTFGDLIIPD